MRRFRVIEGVDPSVALVLLHGRGGSMDTILGKLPLHQIADRPDIVIPEGIRGPWGATSWNADRGVSGWAAFVGSDDRGFIDELTDKYDYVAYVGHSGGAFMAQTMAAEHGRACITFAGTLGKGVTPLPEASCVNFVGNNEPFAPATGPVRIGGLTRQPSYNTQARLWNRHQTRDFIGGHEVPFSYRGVPIAQVVMRLFTEEYVRRTRG